MRSLQIRRRACRCLLAVVVRDGDRYVVAKDERAQIMTSADRWEPRRIVSSHPVPLEPAQCPITLGCRHGKWSIHTEGSNVETAIDVVITAARRGTKELLVGV